MLRSLAVGAGAALLVGGVAVAGAAAQGSAPAAAPAAPVSDARLASLVTVDEDAPQAAAPAARTRRALCARVPAAITRTQALEKRLAAGADTKGSLAWLKARVDAAEAAHRTDLAKTLSARLAFRTELAQFLPHRLELLQKASTTVCAPAAATS